MTDEEIEQGIENACSCSCSNPSPGWTVNPYPIIRDYIRRLKAENAELCERLDKAVELPRVECIVTREWMNREMVGDIMFEWCVLYKKDGYLMAEPCLSKESAEARLAELKGGKE